MTAPSAYAADCEPDQHEWEWVDTDGSAFATSRQVRRRWCAAHLETIDLFEAYVSHQRMVATGVAVIAGELDQMRADLVASGRELRVSLDDMPPGSLVRRLVIANRTLHSELRKLRDELRKLRDELRSAQQDAHDYKLLCDQLEVTRAGRDQALDAVLGIED